MIAGADPYGISSSTTGGSVATATPCSGPDPNDPNYPNGSGSADPSASLGSSSGSNGGGASPSANPFFTGDAAPARAPSGAIFSSLSIMLVLFWIVVLCL
jgi:hypothetical protein